MPDVSDVEIALVNLIGDAILQTPLSTDAGTGLTTDAGTSLTADNGIGYMQGQFLSGPGGGLVSVRRGWPDSTQLSDKLGQGAALVNVWPDQAMQRNTTRYLGPQQAPVVIVPPTITLTVSGETVTVGGLPGEGQVVGLLIGPKAHATGYAYRCTATDTLASVAVFLAGVTPSAVASGATIVLPPGTLVQARVGADQSSSREVRRQEQVFCVRVYAQTPLARDAVASAVDQVFAPISFFTVGGYAAYVRWIGSATDDYPSKATVWLRTLRYMVEYPTTVTETDPEALFITIGGLGYPITV
jgi:hypothetical protein